MNSYGQTLNIDDTIGRMQNNPMKLMAGTKDVYDDSTVQNL